MIDRSIKASAAEIIAEDATILLSNKNPRAGKKLSYVEPLRRITVFRSDRDEPLILVTNDLIRDAVEVAKLYKSRWLIELFFKWIKQNLRMKLFMGRSENAVKIQILTALIAFTLIASLHQEMQVYATIREMLLMIKTRLFLPVSFEKPPPRHQRKATTNQLILAFGTH